ncbi:hypothetical protein CYMTET_17834, partial [Cymbomonas tetramitiformis]
MKTVTHSSREKVAQVQDLLRNYEEQIHTLQQCSDSYLNAGLLAKHVEAKKMIEPLEASAKKLRAMLPPELCTDKPATFPPSRLPSAGESSVAPNRVPPTSTTATHPSPTDAAEPEDAPEQPEHEVWYKFGGSDEWHLSTGDATEREVWGAITGVEVKVWLPKLEDAADSVAEVVGHRSVELHCGRVYALQLQLAADLDADTCQVKFNRKSRRMRILLQVATTATARETPRNASAAPVPEEGCTLGPTTTVRVGADNDPVKALEDNYFTVVDDFLTADIAQNLVKEVQGLDSSRILKDAEVEGGQHSNVRGDRMAWIGSESAGPAQRAFSRHLDMFMLKMMDCVPSLDGVPLVRDKAMVTVYP